MAERTDWGGLLQEERFGEAAAARPIPAPAF
jgi:hypothetical protein